MASGFATAENIPLMIISTIAVSANVMVCVLVFFKESLRTHTNGFVVSLAVSDILIGGVLLPVTFAGVEKTVQGYIVSIALLAGVANVSTVTLDRYIAVLKPFKYDTIMRKHFTKILITSWSLVIGMSVLPLIWSTNDSSTVHKVYVLCEQLLFVIGPYVFVFIAYYHIFRQVQRTVQMDRKLNVLVLSSGNGEPESCSRRAISSSESKITRISIIITSTFLLTWLPVEYLTLMYYIGQKALVPSELPIISLYTIALGSLVDPMLYSFLKPDFRHAIKQIVRKCVLYRQRSTGLHATSTRRSHVTNGNTTTQV